MANFTQSAGVPEQLYSIISEFFGVTLEECNDEFLFCHWVAKSKDDVYKQLEEDGLEGKFLNSIVHEANEFLSAFRNSEEILESFPEDGMYW